MCTEYTMLYLQGDTGGVEHVHLHHVDPKPRPVKSNLLSLLLEGGLLDLVSI